MAVTRRTTHIPSIVDVATNDNDDNHTINVDDNDDDAMT